MQLVWSTRGTIDYHTHDLVLDGRTCSPEQFTCQEGQCIPSNYRCDRVKDCVDNSDENNCSKTFCHTVLKVKRIMCCQILDSNIGRFH